MSETENKPEGLFKKRWGKFKTLRRGYISFLILVSSYILSWFLLFFVNDQALVVQYEGHYSFPVFWWYSGEEYDLDLSSEPSWRMLKVRFSEQDAYQDFMNEWLQEDQWPKTLSQKQMQGWFAKGDWKTLLGGTAPAESKDWPERFHPLAWEDMFDIPVVQKLLLDKNFPREFSKADFESYYYPEPLHAFLTKSLQSNWVMMPIYPYGPRENTLREMEKDVTPPTNPELSHWMGTDKSGRDVLARLVYGYRVSLSFSLTIVFITYFIGITIGAMLGYFGGKFDILVQRLVEIWSSMPFLYTVMLVSSLAKQSFVTLVAVLSAFTWMGITYYVRGEFYREKAKDYVAAAVAQGEGNFSIMFRQILPNALTPVVTFAPFAIVGNTMALVTLDFLGFGLPADDPSWGDLMKQGQQVLTIAPWLFLFPLIALFIMLLLVVFVGEAIREAFDPKVFSRLR